MRKTKCNIQNAGWGIAGEGKAKIVLRKSQCESSVCASTGNSNKIMRCTHVVLLQHNSPQACIRLLYKEDDDPLLFMPTEDGIKYFAQFATINI